MLSSPEIQVADGDPEAYLWPSEAIRQQAIDLLMERVQKIAVEKITASTNAAIDYQNEKTKAETEKLRAMRDEASAAISRLEAMIQKAEQTVVGLPPTTPVPSENLRNDYELNTLGDSVREIAKVCWLLQDIMKRVNGQLINKGIYINDSDLMAKMVGPLIADELMKDFPIITAKLSNAASKCGVYVVDH